MVEYEDLNLFHVSLKLMLLHYIIQSQCSTRRKTNQGSFSSPDITVKLQTDILKTSSQDTRHYSTDKHPLQKGGVPAAPSGTATLLRLSPNHQFCPRPILAVTDFRHPRLSWLDGRCVQGPGTYSPRHG